MNAPIRVTALTYAAMNELIPAMLPGQAMIYHVGSLMYDRLRGPSFQTAHGVAMAAYEAYQRGEVTLVQRKTGPLCYDYLAIRRNAAKVDGKVARQRAYA